LLFLPGLLGAQRSGTNREDLHDLFVRVVLSNERPAPDHLRVELLNSTGDLLGQALTGGDGQVQFTMLRSGNYRLRVRDARIKDAVSEMFTINWGESTYHETVYVEPVDTGTPNSPGSGTASALELDVPSKAKKEFNKGNEALDRRNWPEARKHLEKAIELYPKYVSAYNNLGLVWMKSGEPTKAREAFEKAVTLDSSFSQAYLNLGRIANAEHRYTQAEEYFNKALAGKPLDPDALFLLAYAELMSGKFDQVIANVRKLHSLPHERYAIAHYLCAQAFQAKKLNAEAVTEYQTYVRESPNGDLVGKARAALAALSRTGP
jgi:tetratricopeptide (TPR) repeat protein